MKSFSYRGTDGNIHTRVTPFMSVVEGYCTVGKGKAIHLVKRYGATLCGAERSFPYGTTLDVPGNDERHATCRKCAKVVENYLHVLSHDAPDHDRDKFDG